MNKIYYVDGVCGSFKTTKAADFAAHAAQNLNAKIIFAQPTTKLLSEWHQYFQNNYPDLRVHRIDSTTDDHAVFRKIIEFVMNHAWDNDGIVLMISHAALFENPTWANQDYWNVICDEIPAVDGEFSINISAPESAAFLT